VLACSIFVSAGCTSSGGNTQPALTAGQICRAAATDAQSVVAAHLSTVGQVRADRGGPRNTSPAEKPWAKVRDGAPAAWCSFKTPSEYLVAAATKGDEVVMFIHSETMIDPGSEGPAIP
jgi:hypothetical protein